ncbi:hypothetical protein VPH35_074808 [Triticum aestivum]
MSKLYRVKTCSCSRTGEGPICCFGCLCALKIVHTRIPKIEGKIIQFITFEFPNPTSVVKHFKLFSLKLHSCQLISWPNLCDQIVSRVKYPDRVTLIRGNHEQADYTSL